MQTPAERWADQAQYDLETARAMLDGGRYLYVVFCAQQAVEKMLKSLVVRRTGEFPPRLHSLPRLAVVAGLAPDRNQSDVLVELSAYYVQTRYPEEIESAGRSVDRELACDILRKTEELMRWLASIAQ